MRYIILLVLLNISFPSHACSCGAIDIKKVITQSKYVFVAGIKSVKINKPDDDNLKNVVAEFELLESIKGNSKEIKKLYSGFGGGDCGVPLNVGWQYIVYTNNDVVSVCSGSGPYPGKENDDGYTEAVRAYIKSGKNFDPDDFFLFVPSDSECEEL